MGKQKTEQRIKFRGQPGQIYNIGRKAFAHNVWRVATDEELAHVLSDPNIRALFDFNPALPTDAPAEIPVVKYSRRRKAHKKEDD